MDTQIVRIDPERIDGEAIGRAGEIIRAGGLVAFPTETVYGLGGDALNRDSSRKIYLAKGRPSDNPLIVHICKMEDMEAIVERIPREAELLARAFWPGPLTMILPRSELVPRETTGGLDTVAVRLPSHPVALALIEASGGYIAAPSANLSGRPSPTLAKYVEEDMAGRIEMIIDGGEVGIGLESTIIDLSEEKPVILRPGRVTRRLLESVMGPVEMDRTVLDGRCGQAPKAPGMKYRHYAPRGEMTIVSGEAENVREYINREAERMRREGRKVGVIAAQVSGFAYKADAVKIAGRQEDGESISRNLYRILREFDDEGVTAIYSEAFKDNEMGEAVMNRLLKAAGHHVEYV